MIRALIASTASAVGNGSLAAAQQLLNTTTALTQGRKTAPTPSSASAPANSRQQQASFAELVEQSLNNDRDHSQQELIAHSLAGLSADEARLLSSLSDGKAQAVIAVQDANALGLGGLVLEAFISNIGRQAGIATPELSAQLLRRLYSQGLLQAGPTLKAQANTYELLETDSALRALSDAISDSGGRPKLHRYSIQLSELGTLLVTTVTDQ